MKNGYRLVPMVVVMGIIFFLSHQEATFFRPLLFAGEDKFFHLGAYGVLAATVIFACPPWYRLALPLRVFTICIFFSSLYGMTDELHQSFIPGRSCSGLDLVADVVGALLMALGWLYWRKRHS